MEYSAGITFGFIAKQTQPTVLHH